jgi:hypothetical protein
MALRATLARSESSTRRLKPGCRSRQAAARRSTRRSSFASALQPRVCEEVLSRRLDLRGIDLLDRTSLGHRVRRLSGDGAKRKRSSDRQIGDGLYEH